MNNIRKKNEDWWLYTDIKRISEYLGIEIEKVCFYPDNTRKLILERYYDGNEVERE